MENLILKSPDANFFFDETPIGGLDGISPEDLKAFAKKISPKNFFWIASHHNHPRKEDLEPGTCQNDRIEQNSINILRWSNTDTIHENLELAQYGPTFTDILGQIAFIP